MHVFRAMNADFHTYGLDEREQGRAESWFSFVENHLSRFRQDSELNRLSEAHGQPFLASSLLFEALFAANQYYLETAGLFNPFLARELSGLGYKISFERIQSSSSVPYAVGLKVQQTRIEYPVCRPRLQFNPLLKSIMLEEGAALDLGGIAKGWSAERLSAILKREGVESGAIDAGGDVVIWGTGDSYRAVSIADPLDDSKDLMMLDLPADTGIATSSRVKRAWADEEGNRLHHIIDPRTLRPASSDLLQVTVWGPSLTAAEVYAKCVLILGSDQGKTWLEQKHPRYSAIGVGEHGRIMATDNV